MNRLLSSLAAFAFVASLATGAIDAKQCRNAKGQFTKCPAMQNMSTKKTCRDKHGKFMKCAK
jgi:hypothetical protein